MKRSLHNFIFSSYYICVHIFSVMLRIKENGFGTTTGSFLTISIEFLKSVLTVLRKVS